MRRIEALTGQGVFDYYNDLEKKLEEAAKTVKATPANLQEKLEHLMADLKSLQAENESLKSKAAKEALGDVMDQVQDVNGVKMCIRDRWQAAPTKEKLAMHISATMSAV